MSRVTAALRSHLYVPGNRPALFEKAAGGAADALILDLEDAVPVGDKDQARHDVADFIRACGAEHSGAALWVRVNPGPLGRTDLEAVCVPGLSGVVLAKATAEDILAAGAVLDGQEVAQGMPPGAVVLCPLLETPAAILDVEHLAALPRVERLQVGEADLSAELGIEQGPGGLELLWVRSRVVVASAAAGIAAPVAPVTTDFTDLEALRRSTDALRRMGYRGRACIHPAQLDVVNEVFTPSEEEVGRARDLITRFEASRAAGSGVFVDTDGRMVDLAVVRSAQQVLESVRTSS